MLKTKAQSCNPWALKGKDNKHKTTWLLALALVSSGPLAWHLEASLPPGGVGGWSWGRGAKFLVGPRLRARLKHIIESTHSCCSPFLTSLTLTMARFLFFE